MGDVIPSFQINAFAFVKKQIHFKGRGTTFRDKLISLKGTQYIKDYIYIIRNGHIKEKYSFNYDYENIKEHNRIINKSIIAFHFKPYKLLYAITMKIDNLLLYDLSLYEDL
jgi:hypothetical protein